MTKMNLFGQGSTGTFAIWAGEDDAPFHNPLDHLSNGRVKFHSSLRYVKVIDERSFNVSFSARTSFNGDFYVASTGTFTQNRVLFAHGQSGQPWCLASARIAGQDVAFTGSLPVQRGTFHPSGTPSAWARWVTIGVDNSNVNVFEYTVVQRDAETGFAGLTMPAITIPIKIWVTDKVR